MIAPDRVEPFLQQLPVDALWGVGPVTARKLRGRGISRLVDVRAIDEGVLREAVGSMADWLRQLANGIDDRPVVRASRAEIIGLGEHVCRKISPISRSSGAKSTRWPSHAVAWLERKDLLARTVTIKVRYSDFTTITRSHTAPPLATRSGLSARALQLLEKTSAGQRPIRLLGVSVHNLCTAVGPKTESDDWLPFSE